MYVFIIDLCFYWSLVLVYILIGDVVHIQDTKPESHVYTSLETTQHIKYLRQTIFKNDIKKLLKEMERNIPEENNGYPLVLTTFRTS
jgi:hypothetical protein